MVWQNNLDLWSWIWLKQVSKVFWINSKLNSIGRQEVLLIDYESYITESWRSLALQKVLILRVIQSYYWIRICSASSNWPIFKYRRKNLFSLSTISFGCRFIKNQWVFLRNFLWKFANSRIKTLQNIDDLIFTQFSIYFF